MSPDRSSVRSADPTTLNRLNATAVIYWSGIFIGAGVLTLWWFALGPDHPAVALLVTAWTFALTPGVAGPAFHRVPRTWHRVHPSERLLHRMLGVGRFGWLLERSGWNRQNAYLPASITKARVPIRALAAQGGASAHGTCFAIHLLLSALAMLTGHLWGALWIMLPGVVVHLYPMLLQRAILLRLQPLVSKLGATL